MLTTSVKQIQSRPAVPVIATHRLDFCSKVRSREHSINAFNLSACVVHI